MRTAILTLAAVVFAGTAGAAEYEVPWQDVAANVQEHRVIEAMDEASFAAAQGLYPGTKENTDHYAVGVGRYLMWRIVGLFLSDQTVDTIRLGAYEQRCDAHTDEFGSSVECTLSAVLEVEEGGNTHRITFDAARPVGAWMRPSEPYRPAVAAELRMPIDDFVAHIRTELRGAGIVR